MMVLNFTLLSPSDPSSDTRQWPLGVQFSLFLVHPTQAHMVRCGTTHCGLGFLAGIINQENCWVE